MACNDNIQSNCTRKNYAVCIEMDGDIPEFSSLSDDTCINLQEVADDVYQLIGGIKTDSDLSELESQCFSLPTEKTIKNFILMLMTKICTLEERIETLENSQETQDTQIADLQNDICPEP